MIPMNTREALPALLIGCALLLSACAAGPDFVAPGPPQTKTYTIDGDTGLKGAQRIVTSQKLPEAWWRTFGSRELDGVMLQALAGNNTLEASRARLAQAHEEVNAATGALWPQVSMGAVAGGQKYGVALFGPSDIQIPAYTYYTLGPQVTYLLDFAGGERRATEEAQAMAEYKGYQLDALRLSITGNVMAQALSIASARAQLSVLADIMADDQRNLDLVRIARKAGSGTITDVLSAESQLAGDLALLPPLRQQLSVARHALAILVGKAPGDWRTPDFDLSAFSLPGALPLTLPSELVRVRPDIRASEAQLHAATAALGVATANLYPSITLSANTLQESLTTGGLFDSSANTWAFAAGLTAPIFNGGTLQAKKRAAQDTCLAALAAYRQVVLESFGQVADVLKALEHDAEQIDAQQHAAETALAALNLARLSYSAGNIGVIQVLDAERQSNQARLGLTLARVRQYQDTALLSLALGGGLPEEKPAPESASEE